jgi:hypothetical protein
MVPEAMVALKAIPERAVPAEAMVAVAAVMRATHRGDGEEGDCDSETSHVSRPFAGSGWMPRVSRLTGAV